VEVLQKYSTNPAYRRQALMHALEAGVWQHRSPRAVSQRGLVGVVETPDSQAMSGRRTRTARTHPDWARDASTSPLWLYSRQSEVGKALVWQAGRERAARAIDEYRATGSQDLPRLMWESKAATFDQSWQRQFINLVASGQDKEARDLIAAQLVQSTMFQYE